VGSFHRTVRTVHGSAKSFQHAAKPFQHAAKSFQLAVKSFQLAVKPFLLTAKLLQHAEKSFQHTAKSFQHTVKPLQHAEKSLLGSAPSSKKRLEYVLFQQVTTKTGRNRKTKLTMNKMTPHDYDIAGQGHHARQYGPATVPRHLRQVELQSLLPAERRAGRQRDGAGVT
jgi:hypothetical protein